MRRQAGTVGAVDVDLADGTTIMRVFVFVTDADTLTPGTLEEAENTVVRRGTADARRRSPASTGKTFPDPSGVTIFVAAEG